MAQCKKTAQEFVQDAFSPVVAVICSHDAELVAQKNNLTFVELIQPFCRLNVEAHIRDPSNMSHTVRNLRIIANDINQHPPQPTLARKMMNEAVANAYPGTGDLSRNNVVTVGDYDLQLSNSTPWFEAFRDCFLTVTYPADHEFTRHYLACIFVVSSSHADPMDQFGKLTQQQHQQQHQQPHKLPKWFCPNVLRYYLLVHDVSAEQESKAEAIYQTMKATYGVNSCHLLQINSKTADVHTDQVGMPDPWSQFLKKKSPERDLLLAENDFEAAHTPLREVGTFPGELHEGAEPEVTPDPEDVESALEATEGKDDIQLQSSIVIDHPLAPDVMTASADSLTGTESVTDNCILRDSQNNPISSGSPPGSSPVTGGPAQHGACLSLSDHDRLRIFVHEFIVRGLIPWSERMLRILSDQMTTRKGIGRNLFSATKKWFGSNKPNQVQAIMAEKTNVVYTTEAPEMQMRRLADLAFLFQLYEIAYQTYHQAKKDFNNDHAWLHYAGALEMASMAVYMQGGTSQRQYPQHYMESAVTCYLNTCKAPQFATRATLLSTEALKSKGMYAEAAMQLIKMTSEDSDLRSALLLEQAAHCFIKMKQPMVRKYAFHMILAGHRFSKSGQRKHALRSYTQALQIYKGKSWALAEDHINFTIGRQSFNLKQLDNATAAFKHLLTYESKQSSPQQNAFLREYLFVYKQQLAQLSPESSPTGGELFQLPLPVVDGNATKVLCCHLPAKSEGARIPASSVSFDCWDGVKDTWKKLEELIMVSNFGSIPFNFRQSLQCYNSKTSNSLCPINVLGEPITVEVCLTNPLKIPLVLSEILLLWKFIPVDYLAGKSEGHSHNYITNESDISTSTLAGEIVKNQVIPEITLQSSETRQVHLSLSVHQTGELHLTGMAYNMSTNPPVPQNNPSALLHPSPLGHPSSTPGGSKASQQATISVRGKLNLDAQGPRLNNSKAEKAGKMYGPDRRLDLVIVPPMPRLEVFFSEMPNFLLCGEVRQVTVELVNSSPHALTNLKLASTNPEFFTFGNCGNRSCDNSNPVYPTCINTSDCDGEEVVADLQSVVYVLSLPVPGGSIEPGQSVCLPMWIRGPERLGTHSVDFLFHYQPSTNNPKLSHRVLRHTVTVTVNNSLVLRATALRTATCDKPSQDAPGRPASSRHMPPGQLTDILTHLEVENMNSIQDSSITEFNILQVSCASSQWHLHHLSTCRNSDIKIGSKESTPICFKASQCEKSVGSKQTVFTNVTFDQHKIDSSRTPCSDFYHRSRLDMSFEGVEVEPPKAAMIPVPKPSDAPDFSCLESALQVDLTLIVLWRAFQVDESGDSHVIVGQHHVTINKINSPVVAPPTLKIPVEQPPVKIIQDVLPLDSIYPSTEVTSQLLKYSLSYQQNIIHDFQKSRTVLLPVSLVLKNCAGCELEVEVDTNKHVERAVSSGNPPAGFSLPYNEKPSTQYSWSGQTFRRLSLASDGIQTLSLKACFCKPGVFDLGCIQIKAAAKQAVGGVTIVMTTQKTSTPSLVVIHTKDPVCRKE